jgi:hypothetical protein
MASERKCHEKGKYIPRGEGLAATVDDHKFTVERLSW